MPGTQYSLGQRRVIRLSLGCVLFLLGGLLLLVGCSQNPQTSGKSGGPRLSLKQQTYDFGKISPTQQVVKEIEFTNSGTQPLVIKDVLPVPPPEGG